MMVIKKTYKSFIGPFFIMGVVMPILVFSCTTGSTKTVTIVKESLPLDTTIQHGRLPNGLTYFIKAIPDPTLNIKMKLIHRAGSNQETGDQFDMAHAIEHLAFNETNHFPEGILNSKLLEGLGYENFKIRASSGRKNTQYTFEIFNSAPSGIDAGLTWFRDIATGLKLTPQSIESVRGEVRQEFLGKRGSKLNETFANLKMYHGIFPCEPKELDQVEHYNNFLPAALRRYYDKWYRPDLLSVVIVGNVKNPIEVENLVKKKFSDIPFPEEPLIKEDCDSLFFRLPPQFVVVGKKIDPTITMEENTAEIHLFFREPDLQQINSRKKFERLLKFEVVKDVLMERLVEDINLQKNSISIDDLMNSKLPPGLEIIGSFENGSGKKIITDIVTVINQLRSHGISKQELERIKTIHLAYRKNAVIDQIRYWLDEIADYYVTGEALPSDKNKILVASLKALTVTDFNEYLKNFLANAPQDIGIIAPPGHEALSYKEVKVRTWINDGLSANVEPFIVPDTLELMRPQQVEALKMTAYTEIENNKSDAREFILQNGVKLVLKQAYFKDQENPLPVYLHGFASNGANIFSSEDYWSAINAPAIIEHSGVNGLTKPEIDRNLAKNQILPGAVSPYIDYAEHGIYGATDKEDLPTMMQLVYLYFTKPNKDIAGFEEWKYHMKTSYVKAHGYPATTDFLNKAQYLTGDKSLRTTFSRKLPPGGTLGFKSVKKTDFQIAYDIYNRLFSNADGFTFIITGDFEDEEVLLLAQKYLGNLPINKSLKKEAINHETFSLQEGPTFREIPNEASNKMLNAAYGTIHIQKAEDLGNWEEQLKVESLGEVVRQKLMGLRFKKGYGLYDMAARGSYNDDLERYEINSFLFCQPEEIPLFQEEVKNIFSQIKSGSISKIEMEEALGLMQYFHTSERAERTGSYIKSLYKHYKYSQPWKEPFEIKEFINNLSVSDIMEVAQKYLKEENLHEFVLKEVQ